MTDATVIKAWKENFEKFIIRDIERAIEKDNLEVGLIILTFVAVECLSGYYAGRVASGRTFIKLIKECFPSEYKPFAGRLYGLRSDLAHNYAPRGNFLLKREINEPHLTPYTIGNDTYIWFNRQAFARDFLNVWKNYVDHVSEDDDLYSKLVQRIKAQGYLVVI